MRKNSESLHDKTTTAIFNHVQFPLEYWYPQDNRGIVDRSFDYSDSSGAAEPFAIVNPNTGKVRC